LLNKTNIIEEPLTLESEMQRAIRSISDFPKPGILFRDITPLFYDQKLCSKMALSIINNLPEKPDAIAGIESRGFLIGMIMANQLNIPFVLMRKAGKLPGPVLRAEYSLEYGSAILEVQEKAIQPNWKIMVHDDLLATGGTANAAAQLVLKSNAFVSSFSFLVALNELNGANQLKKFSKHIVCLTQY